LHKPLPFATTTKLLRSLLLLLVIVHVHTALASQELERATAGSTPPVVKKIEPPNWWTGFTPEVMLLLNGNSLAGAHVETGSARVRVNRVESSANGHYLFVWLKTESALRPGTISLRIKSAAGSTTAQLPILARKDPHGHFEGISQDDVIYLIMPDRFADGDPSNDQPPGSAGTYDRSQPGLYHGGDLRGVRQHLSYLHDLGVTTLWLTPVWKNTDTSYHGYHVVDFFALDDHMGSMTEYQGLVADAHKLGIKVLIDFVANHTGPKHPWANDPPTPTWLHGTPSNHLEPAYTFSGIVDPHASPRQYRHTLEGWFAGTLPDLNPDDPFLAEYLAQNALWWTEMAQLDGFRIDTFPYSSRHFWSGWHQTVRSVYPKINSIGEIWDPDASVTSFFAGGRKEWDGIDSGLQTMFDFPLSFALRDVVIRGQSVQKIVDVLQKDALYLHPEMLVTFLGNHDTRRFISEENSSREKLRAGLSLLLTLRGIPEIYAGDEIAMPGGDDPDNRRDFPGGFPNDTHNAFEASGRTRDEQDLFSHVQSLLRLRRDHAALRSGRLQHIGWDESYYAFVRETPEEKLLVVFNNAPAARDLRIPLEDTPLDHAQKLDPIFGSAPATIEGKEAHIAIPATSVVIFTAR
jgi:neopullulanase